MKFLGQRGPASSNTRRSSSADEAQSEEVLRVRARRRLIGAVVLVLTGVVVFPLIFETQPRPVASTMNLVVPPQAQASAALPIRPTSAPAKPASATALAPVASTPARPAPVATLGSKPLTKPVASAAASAAHKPAQIAASGAKPKPSEGARKALAALAGKQPEQISSAEVDAATQPAANRFVIQAGAFADPHGALQLRHKIEVAGYKSFSQDIETHQGKRYRVRVGPFASRAQADKALAHLKALGISGAVLML